MHKIWHAVNTKDWAGVADMLDDRFFEYLFTDATGLAAVFDAADPEWFEQFPRQVMSRAMVAASATRSMVIDDVATAKFGAWVAGQDRPATRDRLGVLNARMRQLLAAGRYTEASVLADESAALIAAAPEAEGFQDVLPATLMRCGIAKMLAGELDAGIVMLGESLRWARTRGSHPVAAVVSDHLALASALVGRYSAANDELGNRELGPTAKPASDATGLDATGLDATGRDVDDSQIGGLNLVSPAYQTPRLLARLLVAVAALDHSAIDELLGRVDEQMMASEWAWVVIHARAHVAMLRQDPASAVPLVEEFLARSCTVHGPESMPGGWLRSDLADLYQSIGDLRTADRLLNSEGLPAAQPMAALSSARLALLRGYPRQALQILEGSKACPVDKVPLRHRPAGAVLAVAAEAAVAGQYIPASVAAAAALVRHHAAFSALAQVDPITKDHIAAAITTANALAEASTSKSTPHQTNDGHGKGDSDSDSDGDGTPAVPAVPQVFRFRLRLKLTRRESELIAHLRAQRTVPDIAQVMHLSPNTVKTHLKNLYRKLGVSTRDDALWAVEARQEPR